MLELNALKFNIEDKSPLGVAKPQPVEGFRPVICSARSYPYKCGKSLSTAITTSSTVKVGAGFSMAVRVGASAEVGTNIMGVATKTTFSKDITKTASFSAEYSKTTQHTTTDKTDVAVDVPANTEVKINVLRTVQDLKYKWKAVFELLGKYSVKYAGEEEIFEDVTTVLWGSKRQIYASGSWEYKDTDFLRVVITDKYGDERSGCEHKPGKGKTCEL